VVDPQTSALLAFEQVTLAGNELGYPAGTRVGYATYETAIVASRNALRSACLARLDMAAPI